MEKRRTCRPLRARLNQPLLCERRGGKMIVLTMSQAVETNQQSELMSYLVHHVSENVWSVEAPKNRMRAKNQLDVCLLRRAQRTMNVVTMKLVSLKMMTNNKMIRDRRRRRHRRLVARHLEDLGSHRVRRRFLAMHRRVDQHLCRHRRLNSLNCRHRRRSIRKQIQERQQTIR